MFGGLSERSVILRIEQQFDGADSFFFFFFPPRVFFSQGLLTGGFPQSVISEPMRSAYTSI